MHRKRSDDVNHNQFFAGLLAECHFHFGRYEEAIESSKKVVGLTQKIPCSIRGKEFREKAEKIMRDANEILNCSNLGETN